MKPWLTKEEAGVMGFGFAAMTGLGFLLNIHAHGFWEHVGIAGWYSACGALNLWCFRRQRK